MNTITKKLLLILIAYIPFQLALNLAPDMDVASGRVLILIIFGLWLFGGLARKKVEIPSHPITYLILIFLFLAGLSLVQDISWERGLRKILVFASIFPLYFLITGIFSVKTVKSAIKVMVFSSLALAIVGLIQFFSQFLFGIKPVYQFWAHYIAPTFLGKTFTAAILANPSWLVNVGGKTFLRATSLFPDPHMFSFYLGLVIPLAFVSLFYCKKKGVARHAPTIFCLLIVAQLLTFSRGGYLGLLVALPLMILLLWRIFEPKLKIFVAAFILLSIIAIFIFGSPILYRLTSLFDLKEPSNLGRLLIWGEALDFFYDHPFLGVGIGSYSELVNPAAPYRVPIYAHNTYLDIAVEMGVFALIAWLGIFLVTLKGLWKTFNKVGARHATPLKILSAGLIGSLVWFSVHALVETPIFSPRILPMLMVVLGLGVVIIKNSSRKSKLVRE